MTLADRYAVTCEAAERKWEPIIASLRERGIQGTVEQTGGMVFCVVVQHDETPDSGWDEVAWGVADECWGGGDINGERVWTSSVPSDAQITPEVATVLAEAIAASVADVRRS